MKLEALLPYLLTDLPGVPDVTAKQALILTAIDFCQQSHAWNEIQDPMTIEDGVNEYDVEVEQGARVVAVKNVFAANRELRPVTMKELQQVIPNWQSATGSLPSYYNAPVGPESIRIYPIPLESNGAALTMRVAFAPTLAATSIPDSIVNRYLDTLISGAKHRLMMTPEKGWSNLQLAAYHQTQFDDGVVRAKIDILHDNAQGSIKVAPVRFG